MFQVHFEDSQFERNRVDGKKKLRWNAVPTLFNVPNPPKPVTLRRALHSRFPLHTQISERLFHDHSYFKKGAIDAVSSNATDDNCVDEQTTDVGSADTRDESVPGPSTDSGIFNVDTSFYSDCIFTSDNTTDDACVPEQDSTARAVDPSYSLGIDDNFDERNTNGDSGVDHNAFPCSQNTNDSLASHVEHLKRKVKQLTQQLRNERKKNNQLVANLRHFLAPEQIRYLKLPPKSARTIRWSNATIKKCLQLRYTTGRNGYSHLRRLGYPVPAYRTLCNRVVNAEFRPGIQREVFQWLQVKMASQSLTFRDCSIALDEMQMRPCVEYDKGTTDNLFIYTKLAA